MARERVHRYRTRAPRFWLSTTTHDGLQSCGRLLCCLRSGGALQSFFQAIGLDSYHCLYEAHYHGKAAGPIQAADLADLGHRHVGHQLTDTHYDAPHLCHDVRFSNGQHSEPAVHCGIALIHVSVYLNPVYLLSYLDLAPLRGITCNIYSQLAAWYFAYLHRHDLTFQRPYELLLVYDMTDFRVDGRIYVLCFLRGLVCT